MRQHSADTAQCFERRCALGSVELRKLGSDLCVKYEQIGAREAEQFAQGIGSHLRLLRIRPRDCSRRPGDGAEGGGPHRVRPERKRRSACTCSRDADQRRITGRLKAAMRLGISEGDARIFARIVCARRYATVLYALTRTGPLQRPGQSVTITRAAPADAKLAGA